MTARSRLGSRHLHARLSSGSLGEFFAATREEEPQVSGVLVLHGEHVEDLRFSRLLLTEANAAHRLTHPAAIVPVEAAREGEDIYVGMPIAEGPTLAGIVKHARLEGQDFAHRWLCHVGAEIADLLASAHELPWFPGAPAPLVHGAISPRAVHITFDGDVVLTGLGLGRARAALSPSPARLAYVPPERLLEREPTPRSDAYGLGLTLYDAFTGKRTFQRSTDVETRAAIRESNVPPLHAGNLDARLEVSDLLRELLAPRAEARPGDLKGVARILRDAAEEAPDRIRWALGGYVSSAFAEEKDNLARKLEAARRARGPSRPRAVGEGAWTADLGQARPEDEGPPAETKRPGMGLLAADTLREAGGPPDQERLGRYLLGAPFAGSGPRRVLAGRDPNLDRDVVVHILDAGTIDDPRLERQTWLRLFKLEARHAAQLAHPRLPTLLDAGRHGGRYFAVYRRLPGRDLAARLEREGPLSSEEVEQFGADWAEALAGLHAAGLVHGDLRAVNLLLDEARGGFVVDLSMTHALGTTHPLGRTNLLVQAPETLAGGAYDARAEQFAFGGVLYQCVVGTRPFRGLVDEELAAAIRRCKPRSPAEMGVETSPRLAEVIQRLLARDPRDRFSDFEAVAQALRGVGDLRPRFARRPRGPADSSLLDCVPALAALAARVDGLEAERSLAPVRLAEQLASRAPEEGASPAVVAALGQLLLKHRLTSREGATLGLVPSSHLEALEVWGRLDAGEGIEAGPGRRSGELAWLATRYATLARTPEGSGGLSPRLAVQQLREEARAAGVAQERVALFVDLMRERLSALDLSARPDPWVLMIAG
ncbi:MAG: serine/threonine-protein kinase, partial [Myxococcota bacterium]